MFEILSFVFGGVFRLLPEVLKFFDKARDREHEARMFDMQLKADELRAQAQLQRIEKEGEMRLQLADIEAMIAATKAQSVTFQKTGRPWLDAMLVCAEVASAFVRPLLTYWFCVASYGAYKIATMVLVMRFNPDLVTAVVNMWTSYDASIMASIVGFWFVDRVLRKRI